MKWRHFIGRSATHPCLMPQSHPTMGPVRFLSPVRFLARKAQWSAHSNFSSVLFPWSHQAKGPVRLDASAYLWFGWIIRRTHQEPRAMPVRALLGPHTRIFNVFHILRAPYGARAWPARVPYGALMDTSGNWHNHDWQKSRTGVVFGCRGPIRPLTVPARAVHGLFTGCLQSLNPYGARKVMMHALKLYGPRTERQNSYCAARGARAGPVSGCTIFVQNSPWTTTRVPTVTSKP